MDGANLDRLAGSPENALRRSRAAGYQQVKVLEFFDCLGPRQGVKDLRELLHKGAQGDHEAEVFQTSTQQCTKSEVVKHLGVAWIHQHNGLVDETNVTLFAKDLMDYQLARNREQHLAYELFRYREDINEAAFAVAAVDKIYAHESLTFNDIVACEAEIWATKGLLVKAKGKVLALEIIRDHSGNTLRVSHSRIHNKKLEYPMVCTRPDVASAGVDMFDRFDHGLQTNVHVFMDFDYAIGRLITVMSRSITGYGLMILGCAGSLKANLQHVEALSTTKQRVKRMASMNIRLNIEKLDGNIVQKHGGSKQVGLKQLGSKQVGFKQLGPGVETRVHEVHDEKHVWFKVELQGAQGDREAEVFQVSNDDTVVAQRWLKDKQPKKKTNMDCLVKEQEKEYQTGWKIKTGTQQQNGLVDETNVTLFANIRCFLIQSVLYRNMGFNKSREYKKTFTGSGVGTGSMQVLHRFEFEWKAGLKDDIDARSDVYVLSNGYRKCSNDSDGYYWGIHQ
nr:zinc finger, CCHC-type [Tanacetum cinerariifolium]